MTDLEAEALAELGVDYTDSWVLELGGGLALEAHLMDGEWHVGYSFRGDLLPYEILCPHTDPN